MKTGFLAILALAVMAVLGSANTVTLTTDNFESSIEAGGVWMVKFYAPWCGHCKRLAPTWEKLADEVADNEGVHVAKVDCTTQRDVCSAQGVRGYPTLKLFTGGDASNGKKYAGSRDLASLKDYLATHSE